jgi:hypothetical protein
MFPQFLLFLFASVRIHAAPIQYYKPPKVYTILLSNQTRREVKLVNGYSVAQLFSEYFDCHENGNQKNNLMSPLLSHEDCIRFMDRVSEDFYGIHYTPSLFPRSTIEDFYSDHTDLLIYLAHRFRSTSYLEIGCHQGKQNFNKLKIFHEISVGVAPMATASGGEGEEEEGGEGGVDGKRIIQLASDEFFQQNDQLYDLIFIDGNHVSTAEQLWRDLKNSLLVLHDHGTIVIRNLNPRLKDRSDQTKSSVWFNSDGWKVAVAMRVARYYEIVVVDIDHGCAVIRRRKNAHPLPEEFLKKFREYDTLPGGSTLPATHSLTYEDFDRHRLVFYRLMTLVEMREWLEEKEE